MKPNVWLLLALLAAACTPDKRDLRDYYYPVLDYQGGRVYVYETGDEGAPAYEYWYYRTFVRDSGTFFTATYYDPSFTIGQIVREKIVDNGALTRDVFLYQTDSASGKQRPIQAVVEAPNAFPFAVTDSLGVFLYRIRYADGPDSAATQYLVRNRRFLGDGPDFTFEGKTYPTIVFRLSEIVGNNAEGALEIEGTGVEWYARGLGLVYYEKTYGSGLLQFKGTLKERISMQELEKRAGNTPLPGI